MLAPHYGRSVMDGTGVALSVLATIFVLLRFYARSLSRAHLGIDDWTMVPALIICIAMGITQIIAAELGGLGQRQNVKIGDPLVHTQKLLIYEKCKYALQFLAALELAVIKFSVLCFYRRIFNVRHFRIINSIAIAIVTSWGIAFTVATLFQCTPISAIWTQFETDYMPYCVNQIEFYQAGAVSDLILDVFIFILPMPMIARLQMPLRQKVEIAGIFLLGTIVLVAGITRVVIFTQTVSFVHEYPLIYAPNIPYYTSGTLFWSFIENSVGIIGACLPTLRPIVHGYQLPKSFDNLYRIVRKTKLSGLSRSPEGHLSIDSGTDLRAGRHGLGHSNETHVESLPLEDNSLKGITVQRGFYGGEV